MVLDLSVCEQKQSWEENKGDDDGPEENDTEEIPSTDPQETPVADIKQCNLSLEQLRIGEIYDVLDSSGRWCEGEVIKIDRTGNRVFVTYIYWDSRFDEWVDDIPHRIAPLHAHTFTQVRRDPSIVSQQTH